MKNCEYYQSNQCDCVGECGYKDYFPENKSDGIHLDGRLGGTTEPVDTFQLQQLFLNDMLDGMSAHDLFKKYVSAESKPSPVIGERSAEEILLEYTGITAYKNSALINAMEEYASQLKPKSSTLQDVLKLFCEFLENNGYTDSDWREELPSAVDRFLNLPESKRSSVWVSVKERLPDTYEQHGNCYSSGWVLTYNDNGGGYSIGEYVVSGEHTSNGFVETSRKWYICEDDEVTHWCPLPSPPKQEQKQ